VKKEGRTRHDEEVVCSQSDEGSVPVHLLLAKEEVRYVCDIPYLRVAEKIGEETRLSDAFRRRRVSNAFRASRLTPNRTSRGRETCREWRDR